MCDQRQGGSPLDGESQGLLYPTRDSSLQALKQGPGGASPVALTERE